MEEKLFKSVIESWNTYKRYLDEKEGSMIPMNIGQVDEGLIHIFNYYDDHPLTKHDEGQMYNMKWDKFIEIASKNTNSEQKETDSSTDSSYDIRIL